MDNVTKLLLQGAAGGAAGDGEFIDNLFETRLWDGTSGSRTINNGIDLSGEGGLVWIKRRTGSSENSGLFDTVRGAGKWLVSNSTAAESTDMNRVSAFNNNGFSLGSDNMVNNSGHRYVGYTFRKQKKFFDIVTYTGTGSARTVAHNLGSVPGAIIVRKISGTAWAVYHRGVNGGTNPEQYQTELNGSAASYTDAGIWNSTAPTSTHFTVNTAGETNSNGAEYIAYLFAHDEQAFGYKGNNSVIKCGNYTGNGSSNGPDVNVGWEPQWLLVRRTNANEDWMIFDHMRTSERQDMWLDDYRPNNSSGEGDGAGGDSQPYLNWTSTGFKLSSSTGHTNGNGDNYIYIAIRRPDGAVGELPTAGTQVFTPVYDSAGAPLFKTPNHYVDMSLQKNSNWATSGATWNIVNRLRSKERLETQSTIDEQYNSLHTFDFQYGESQYSGSGGNERFSWNWKRYAGFDMVHYTGSGSADYVYHSLGKIPEMIWVKKTSGSGDWRVYHKGLGTSNDPFDYSLKLNGTDAQIDDAIVWNDAAPEINRFTVGTHADVNATGSTYLSILFASVDGISKVGSYNGTGSSLDITTGFQPRFVILKRINGAGAWFVLDTVRGWASGNDCFVLLNSTDAQDCNYNIGAPTSTGFQLNGSDVNYNASGNQYLYYAHA